MICYPFMIVQQHPLVIWKILVHLLIQIFWVLTHLVMQYQLCVLANITTHPYLIRKGFKDWEVVKMIPVSTISKILIFTWHLKFCHCNKYCQLFSLKFQSTLFTLKKMSAKYLHLNNHSLSIFLSNKNSDPREKQPVRNSNNHTSSFPGGKHWISACHRSTACVLSFCQTLGCEV